MARSERFTEQIGVPTNCNVPGAGHPPRPRATPFAAVANAAARRPDDRGRTPRPPLLGERVQHLPLTTQDRSRAPSRARRPLWRKRGGFDLGDQDRDVARGWRVSERVGNPIDKVEGGDCVIHREPRQELHVRLIHRRARRQRRPALTLVRGHTNRRRRRKNAPAFQSPKRPEPFPQT